MRKTLLFAGIASLVLASPMAMAAQTSMKAHSASSTKASMAAHSTTGTVKSVDAKAGTLTLDNGTRYYLPAKMKNADVKSGEKVRVSWSMKSGKHEASSVKTVK